MIGSSRLWIAALCLGGLLVACGGGGGSTDVIGGDLPDNGGAPDTVGDSGSDPGRLDAIDPGTSEDPGTGLQDAEAEGVTDTGAGDLGPGCIDPDGDGYGPGCEAGPDCAPDDPRRFTTTTLYPDGDFDGYGAGTGVQVCHGAQVPAGWSTTADDCDDGDPSTYPGAPELADDGVANGCAGADLVAATADGIFVKAGASVDAAGTREDPVGTLAAGVSKAAAAGIANVFVASGDFSETLVITGDVAIHGGYDATTWTKALATSRLMSSGPVGVRVLDAHLVLNRLYVYGFSNTGDTTPHMTVAGMMVEEGGATLVDCVIGGGDIYASLTDGTQAMTTGLWTVDADVRLVRTRVGSGMPRPVEYSGTGTVERTGVGTAIRHESGSLRMIGGTLWGGGDLLLFGIQGVAIAKATIRNLLVTGGVATLAGVDLDGNVEVEVDDIDANDGLARGVVEADIASIEVSGGARVRVVNCVIAAPRADATADVYIEAAGAADAVFDARINTVAVRVVDGFLDVLHSVFWSDRFSEAVGEAYAPAGSGTGTATSNVRLIDVGAGGWARVVNCAGLSQVNKSDSSLIRVVPGARLRLVHGVFWDDEFGVCRVHDGTSCAIDGDGDLGNCATVSGCDAAVETQVADPLYKWWDDVHAGSPLRDQGVDPVTEGLGAPTDLDGKPRPQGAGFDIGAYEFAP